ncbi:MAG: methyltransferase family protein [Promethearchaeota archaeon]|jgi:protein-S-isoprenylcysteine O-methyltransferase Ste14
MKIKHQYLKVYSIIGKISMCLIPISTSSFLEPIFNENLSYFWQYWTWFSLLGIIFIVVGIRIQINAKKILRRKVSEGEGESLFTKGVYEIVRHPIGLAWILIFLGLTFISDSMFAIILAPLILLLFEIESVFEEKYTFLPKFGVRYENYKKKIPYRLISPPYNYLFFILGCLVIYIGVINLFRLL